MTRSPLESNRFKVSTGQRPAGAPASLLTVTQLTHLVKRAIEQHLPASVYVVGEISNFKRHSSGHLYFVLKDDHCELSCVMWRSGASSLKFDPVDGLEVLAAGQVGVFERSGRYQLYVRRLDPRGTGALELAFRQLREKLAAEGLFDREKKKPLPRFPQRIAVVTSPTGAAVRDILQTLARRYPSVQVYVFPVTVQGSAAAGEIARAIEMLNVQGSVLGGIDLMIVGRGGGSLEDLWAFNEERVARAIFASEIPIISAVGHETDVTISDLVADVRAATPTAAAELSVPLRDELLAGLDATQRRLTTLVRHRMALQKVALQTLMLRQPWREPMGVVRRHEQGVDELVTRLQGGVAKGLHRWHRKLSACELLLEHIRPDMFAARSKQRLTEGRHRLRWSLSRKILGCERSLASGIEGLTAATPAHRVTRLKERVGYLARRLDAMNPGNTLRRGYSITRLKKGRSLIRDPAQVQDGAWIVTDTAGGAFESRVVNLKQLELFD